MTVIRIGVSYRTDGKGKSHLTYDCKAIESLNGSELLKKLLGPDVVIKAVPLPANASNQTELPRSLSTENILKDLEDVDLLYIPGAPTALDSQIGSSLEAKLYKDEESLNKATTHFKKKDDKRIREEYESRNAYEHKLIDIARTRGMSILAVCAGSWRLLESYGGGTRTLAKAARQDHHSKDRDQTWKVKHDIKVVTGTILHGCLKDNPDTNAMAVGPNFTTIAGLNSTHWAVARVNPKNQLVNITPPDPSKPTQLTPIKSLEINASAATHKEASSTVEGYESTHGAPVLGLQFHPENYLPNMLGEPDATEGVKVFSQRIFISAFQAALAYKRRRENNKNFNADHFYKEGLKYYHAIGVAENMQKAAYYFKLSVVQDHADAQVILGDIYENGRIGAKDPKKAVELYKRAASQGNGMGMFCLGHCYEHGIGLERDLEQAAIFYEMAFNKGYEGWKGYYKKFLESHPELQEYLAANKMTVEQQRMEGLKYYHAQGVTEDMHKAALYLKFAAERGDARAQIKLGDIYENGRIGARNPKKAAELYKRAAAQGNAMGMFCVGHCYEYGIGLERDLEQAAIFYEMAFNKGYEGWKGYYKKFLESHPELEKYLAENKMSAQLSSKDKPIAAIALIPQFTATRQQKTKDVNPSLTMGPSANSKSLGKN